MRKHASKENDRCRGHNQRESPNEYEGKSYANQPQKHLILSWSYLNNTFEYWKCNQQPPFKSTHFQCFNLCECKQSAKFRTSKKTFTTTSTLASWPFSCQLIINIYARTHLQQMPRNDASLLDFPWPLRAAKPAFSKYIDLKSLPIIKEFFSSNATWSAD